VLGFIGNDFFPSGDQSEIDVTLTMPPSTSLDATNAAAQQIERILHARPDVTTVYTVVGQSGGFSGTTGGNNTAQVTALLVPPHDRHRASADLGNDLRDDFLNAIPGAKIQIGVPNAFGFGGFGTQPIQVQVQGVDPATVDRLANEVEQAVRGVPGAANVRNSNENQQTQLRAKIDWSRAADLGVTPQNAGAALRAAIDGFRSDFTQLHRPGQNSIDIRILNADATAASVQDIRQLPVTGANGVVRLDQFTSLEQVQIPTQVQHVNRLRSVIIGAEPAQGKLVGDVQNAVTRAVKAVQVPPGYAITYAGQGNQGSDAIQGIFKALGVAVLLMYMLMMVLFGSLTLPLAVLMSLPLAVVGSFGAMALTKTPFTLFSLLGFAVLVGLVGKNAILLVDYTEILQQRGLSRNAALLEAGPTRLRPIVMTTMSVMAALLPIASGLEEGSELLKSAAVVLIGGLLTSTLLTLVFVPAMFTIFDDFQHWVQHRFRRGQRAQPAPSPARSPHGHPAPIAGGADDSA
jgi:HAE1 family hydrophobic/amphiphilic exporter-1